MIRRRRQPTLTCQCIVNKQKHIKLLLALADVINESQTVGITTISLNIDSLSEVIKDQIENMHNYDDGRLHSLNTLNKFKELVHKSISKKRSSTSEQQTPSTALSSKSIPTSTSTSSSSVTKFTDLPTSALAEIISFADRGTVNNALSTNRKFAICALDEMCKFNVSVIHHNINVNTVQKKRIHLRVPSTATIYTIRESVADTVPFKKQLILHESHIRFNQKYHVHFNNGTSIKNIPKKKKSRPVSRVFWLYDLRKTVRVRVRKKNTFGQDEIDVVDGGNVEFQRNEDKLIYLQYQKELTDGKNVLHAFQFVVIAKEVTYADLAMYVLQKQKGQIKNLIFSKEKLSKSNRAHQFQWIDVEEKSMKDPITDPRQIIPLIFRKKKNDEMKFKFNFGH